MYNKIKERFLRAYVYYIELLLLYDDPEKFRYLIIKYIKVKFLITVIILQEFVGKEESTALHITGLIKVVSE